MGAFSGTKYLADIGKQSAWSATEQRERACASDGQGEKSSRHRYVLQKFGDVGSMGIIACNKAPEAKQDARRADRVAEGDHYPTDELAESNQIGEEHGVRQPQGAKSRDELCLAAAQLQYSPYDKGHAQE